MGLWAGITTLLAAAIPEPSPLHVTFSSTELQGETYIWQILEAPHDQFIAAGERVIYYQGGRWTAVNSFRASAIRSLLIDGDYLWVASPGQVGRFRLPLRPDSTYERFDIPGLSDAGEIWHLAKAGEALLIASTQDVWFFNPATKQTTRNQLPNRQHLIVQKMGDDLIVIQLGEALLKVAGTKLEPWENPLPEKSDINWAWTNSSFVLTSKALYHLDHGNYRRLMAATALREKSFVSSTCMWGDLVAIATGTKGVTLFNPENNRVQFLTVASGLSSLVGCCLLPDSQGRLWVGTSKGITLFEPEKYGALLADAASPRFAMRSNGLFISHDDSAVYYHDDGTEESIAQRVYEFIPTRDGYAFGLFAKIQYGAKVFEKNLNNRIGAHIELPSGKQLIVSLENCYLVDFAAGELTPIKAPQTEMTGFAIVGNYLWAAGLNGILYRSSLDPTPIFSKFSDLPGTGSTQLAPLGNLLITASNAGVRFGEKLLPVAGTRDLQNPRLAESAGAVWLLGEQDGIYRLGRLVLSGEAVEWQTVEAKGLSRLPDPHWLSANDRTLLICGENQILELNIDQLQRTYRLEPPQLAFTFADPKSGVTATTNAPPEKLSAEKNSLSFTGTLALDEFGERPTYERRLLPTETAWIATKAWEKVSYPSLSPRNYTLEVRTLHLGHAGTVASRTFTVLPPWYASPGAFAGYGVFALLSFYSIFRLRTHQIRQRNLELERLVDKRTHELAQASAAKTEFLASMSHEIRNPMNGVIGLVNILRDEPLGPRQARTLKMLHGCAEQLRTTVDDILDFSKIEAGRVVLERTTFDLLDTLEASAATIDSGGTKIRFLEPLPPHLALVGDAGKLRQIFANYASNALKYGIPPEARVNTILVPSDDGIRLTLSVTSSGPTIDKDTLDKFFESFTRGQDAMERNIHGTGLGLAICRRYAQAMGGEVGAVSTNGETTFYLNVPFMKADSAALEPVAAPVQSSLPARALAIEDEDYNRIVLGSILTKMNYSVDWATTGAEALKLAQENGYDIILTDYRLPDTNGVDLAREILRLCPEPKPAVFAVTAYSTRERRDECMRAGMAGFISKPITLEKLRTTLAGWGDKQLTTISLEASRRPLPPQPPAAIESGWIELKRAAMLDTKRAAELAHRLNNVCRAFNYLDLAEQLELLEGALERNEPAAPFLQACERLLRPSLDDQS